MPPHLHPRSTATSTLFAGTLLASFVVVAIPHLVPCPRPNNRNHLQTEIQFDEQGKPIRRIRKSAANSNANSNGSVIPVEQTESRALASMGLEGDAETFRRLKMEAEVLKERQERECPVPKPRGLVGRWLGFEGKSEG